MENSPKKPTTKAVDILGVKKLNVLEQKSIKGGRVDDDFGHAADDVQNDDAE